MRRGTSSCAIWAFLTCGRFSAGADPESSCPAGTTVKDCGPLADLGISSFLQVGLVEDKASMLPFAGNIPAGLRTLGGGRLGDQPPQSVTSSMSEWFVTVDVNGRLCMICGEPSAHRSDRDYEKRTDCGNQSLIEHLGNVDVPLISFSRQADGEQPETNAFCELNVQKVCADSIYNKDFLFQAKSIYIPESEPCGETCAYDWWYCKYNGWLKPEIVALMHDFDGMKAESERQCNTKYAKYGWNSTFTQRDQMDAYLPGMARGKPTEDEALIVGAWTCAMGSAGCDMAYCAYTYCDYGDDVVRTYGECEGWDPVKGMPMPARV